MLGLLFVFPSYSPNVVEAAFSEVPPANRVLPLPPKHLIHIGQGVGQYASRLPRASLSRVEPVT